MVDDKTLEQSWSSHEANLRNRSLACHKIKVSYGNVWQRETSQFLLLSKAERTKNWKQMKQNIRVMYAWKIYSPITISFLFSSTLFFWGF